LNKALANAIGQCLSEEQGYSVSAELKLENGRLKPDIGVTGPGGELICLELTWRTTGTAVDGEIAKRQNTLSAGHIQKYLLEKIMEYVKEYRL